MELPKKNVKFSAFLPVASYFVPLEALWRLYMRTGRGKEWHFQLLDWRKAHSNWSKSLTPIQEKASHHIVSISLSLTLPIMFF